MDTCVHKNNSKKRHTPGRNILTHIFGSVILRCLAVGTMFISGYWKISPLWLIAAWGLIKYRDQERLRNIFNQEAAKAIALRNERRLVLSNVDPLPSWIFFTDTEHCEWLNKLVAQVWPSLHPYVLKQLEQLEPALNDTLSKYKKNPNFKFKTASLGSITPRISGIRVYEKDTCNVDRSIIDVHLFYESDGVFNCSIMNNISFGGNKFQFKGCLRIIISTPNASSLPGVEVCFLHQPLVDFNLTGILNIGDLPGISGWIRDSVDGAIAKTLVLPNKYVINYNNRVDYEELKFPDPEGVLRVDVIEARCLGGTQQLYYTSTSNPDSYVTIKFGSKTFKTSSVENTIDPVWNFSAEFVVDTFFDDTVTISVDDQKKGDPLGKLTLSLNLVENKKMFNSWIQLEDVVSGMIHLGVSYHKLENDPELKNKNDMSAILEVLIEDVDNLSNIKDNIFAEISVGEITQSSRSVPTENPVFREIFTFPVKNPKTDKLCVQITTEKDKRTLGKTEFDVNQLLETMNMEIINKQTKIQGVNETSVLTVSMRLRTLKS